MKIEDIFKQKEDDSEKEEEEEEEEEDLEEEEEKSESIKEIANNLENSISNFPKKIIKKTSPSLEMTENIQEITRLENQLATTPSPIKEDIPDYIADNSYINNENKDEDYQGTTEYGSNSLEQPQTMRPSSFLRTNFETNFTPQIRGSAPNRFRSEEKSFRDSKKQKEYESGLTQETEELKERKRRF